MSHLLNSDQMSRYDMIVITVLRQSPSSYYHSTISIAIDRPYH
jgi:hypothetical protein